MNKLPKTHHGLHINRRDFLNRSARIAGATSLGGLLPSAWQFALADDANAPVTKVVNTRVGKVRGKTISGVNAFKGIPYGASWAANFLKAPMRASRTSCSR